MTRGRLLLGTVCATGLAATACGATSPPPTTITLATPQSSSPAATGAPTTTATVTTTPKPAPPRLRLLAAAQGSSPTPLRPAMLWRNRVAAWVSRSAGITTMVFDQRLVGLHLHSGTADAGTLGWRYGPSVAGLELSRLAAAFNGGFRLSTGAGGFLSYGRVAVGLRDGLGSIVTYSDGTTDIGSWHRELPAPGRQVASVRQNLTPLIDHGVAAPSRGCLSCWGATLGGVSGVARSALGIQANGHLVWTGGESLTASELAGALLAAHVVRAVELDINPEWVAGYFYAHRGGRGLPVPVPALPAQHGIPGQFLAPWSRDFFTIVAR